MKSGTISCPNWRVKSKFLFFPVLAGLLAACSEEPLHAVYGHDQCHRLKLFDEERGISVLGAEDIDKLPNGDLIVSAYDRRAETDNGFPPEGGLYRVPKSDLTKQEISVSSLVSDVKGGLRPHGVSVYKISDNQARIGFINRGLGEGDNANRISPSIGTFDLDISIIDSLPQSLTFQRSPKLCRANDLSFETDTNLLVTLDQRSCSGLSLMFERMFERSSGSILSVPIDENSEITVWSDDLSFPNGIGRKILKWPGTEEDQFTAIAETRANRIRFYPLATDKDNRWQPVALPGSPDNITVGKPGIIQVALHPNLVKLALYRNFPSLRDRAPSRIVKVTGKQVLPLFEDPTGGFYSAASIAVQTAGKLVLGSVGDEGLLVCGTEKIES